SNIRHRRKYWTNSTIRRTRSALSPTLSKPRSSSSRARASMTYTTIEIHADHGVAVIWLNRPEVRNAFNETMIADLTAAFGELDSDPEVRAVVLAGRGKVFCAGADLNCINRMGAMDFEHNRTHARASGA